MPFLSTSCPICEEDFKSSDVIHSTYCGHVFHKNCLDDWKIRQVCSTLFIVFVFNFLLYRSNSCPSCRQSYGSTFDHKLFLNFDDQEKDSQELQELKLKLQSAKEKNDQLQDQMNEMEFNFLQLQQQYTTSEQLKKDMQEKIKKQKYHDENFLDLQRQYTESTETIKDLKQLIQELNDENEKNCKEIISLKELSSGLNDQFSDRQVKILEQKLKNLENALTKEIENATQLSVEKIKLERYIAAKENTFTTAKQDKKNENVKRNNSNETDKSVIIENLPEDQLIYPLAKLIVDLGAKMYLPIRFEDILEVGLLDKSKYKQKSNTNIALFVKFKENDMKIKFLANKNVLKSFPITSSYILREYTENTTNSLFVYAEEKLKNNGFAEVFCKNNKVFVKKRMNSKPLQISNRRHVDNFVKRHIEESSLVIAASHSSANPKVDENFYVI